MSARNNLRNNVPEVLRLPLREPVTAVEGGRQIACIVSVSSFVDAGGSIELLGAGSMSPSLLEAHEFGHGRPDARVQRLCRLIVHAAHTRRFAPVLVNGQIVAVVLPPLSRDHTALPSGPWLEIDAELLT